MGVDLASSATNSPFSSSRAVTIAEPRAIHRRVDLDPATLERVKQDYLVINEYERFPRVLAVRGAVEHGRQDQGLRSSLP